MDLQPKGLDDRAVPPNMEEGTVRCIASPAGGGYRRVEVVHFVWGPVPF